MGMPQAYLPDSALQYNHETADNLQFAYELARVHQPHNAEDDPNNKLRRVSPWRGPYQVRHRL